MTQVMVINTTQYKWLCDTWPNMLWSPEGTQFSTGLEVLINTCARFSPRDQVEDNECWLQIIPYTLVLDQKDLSIFGYHRKDCGDKRLVGRFSFGVGGHVEKQDGTGSLAVMQCARRELAEEIGIDEEPLFTGQVICRDDGPVERVHLGLLMVLMTDKDRVSIKEKDQMEGRFFSTQEVKDMKPEDLESWSRASREYYLRGAE